MEHEQRLGGESPRSRGSTPEELAGLVAEDLGGLSLRHVVRIHLGPALILALALAVLLATFWSSGPSPAGADSWGHLYRAEFLADQMRVDGVGAYFTTAWMPDWYLGDPLRTYYPPMTTLVLTPFVFLLGNPFLAYQIFLTLLLVCLASLTYGFLALRMDRWAASLGAILVVLAPYQLRTFFFEGNVPRALALLALPVIAHWTEELAKKSGRRGPALLVLAAAWAWAILSHSQQALIFAVGFLLYIAARLFLDPDLPLAWAGRWLIGLGGGALLSAAWWLPAYSRGELPGVPFLPAVKVELFVAKLSSFLPAVDLRDGRIPIGFGLVVLAILSIAARPDPRRSAYVIAGLLAAWLSLGEDGVLFSLLPLRQQFLPERFLNFSVFALAISAAGVVPFQRRAKLARLFVVVGFVCIDAIPGLDLARLRLPFGEAADLSSEMAHPTEGRSGLLTFPEPTSVEVYYSAKAQDSIHGWALENTPHHPLLRRVLSAAEWSPAYLQRLLAMWDVRQVIVRGTESERATAALALGAAGFGPPASSGGYEIYQQVRISSPVREIPSRQMLLVGDALPPFLMAYPFAQESSNPLLHQVFEADFAEPPALGLMRFEASLSDRQEDVARLAEYLGRGGVVVVDLSGMEDVVGRTLDFLGADVVRVSFQETMLVRWHASLAGLPESLPLQLIAPEGWSGAAYSGLDGVLAEVNLEGAWWPILGYKDVGPGRAWFVGLNLLYYAQLSGNVEIAERIRDLTLDGVEVSRELVGAPLEVTDWRPSGRGLRFSVDVGPTARAVVVAYTYSPRWRATVDGEPHAFGEYEHLLSLELPAGVHEVNFRYDPYGTPWPLFGLGVSLAAATGLVSGYWVERRRYIPLPPGVPPPAAKATPEYAPCANCGFRLAEVGPPTSITYPFQVVHCPICGMRMDDEGFVPGESMDDAAKQRSLAIWLRRNDYDPEVVHKKWGFAAKEFFSPIPLPVSSTPKDPGEIPPHVE